MAHSEQYAGRKRPMAVPPAAMLIRRLVRVVVVAAFVAVYGLLYLRGLDFGSPIRAHPDEWVLSEQAMMMVGSRDFRAPKVYGYGTLGMYVQCAACAATHQLQNLFGGYRDADGQPIRRDLLEIASTDTDRDQFPFYLAGRLSSALYAGGVVALTYLLGRRLFAGYLPACLAALGAMVHPLMVQQGHFSLPNTLALMLGLGALYCAVSFVQAGTKRRLYAGAVLAGLALGAKVTLAWMCLPLAGAALWRLRRSSWRVLPLLALTTLGTFLLVTPPALLDAPKFWADLSYQAQEYSEGEAIDSTDFRPELFGTDKTRACAQARPFLYPVLYWIYQGKGYFAASLIGLAMLPVLAGQAGWLVLLFPAVYLVFIGSYPKVFTPNYLPLVPFWGLGVGSAAAGLLSLGHGRPTTTKRRTLSRLLPVGLAASLALLAPASSSLAVVGQFVHQDPCQAALTWIETHTPKDARIAAERGLGPLFPFSNDGRDVRIEYFGFFAAPYVHFLDRDYVVALMPGMYDKFPWFRVFFGDEGSAKRRYCNNNRALAEKRLILAHQVTPEALGYVRVSELPIVDHDVRIYKVPSVTPIRLGAADIQDSAPPPTSRDRDEIARSGLRVPAGGWASVEPHLDSGEYDLFITLSASSDPAKGVTGLWWRVGRADPKPMDIVLSGHASYAGSFTVASPGQVEARFGLGKEQGGAEAAWIREIVIVPVPGDVCGPPSPRQR